MQYLLIFLVGITHVMGTCAANWDILTLGPLHMSSFKHQTVFLC